MNFMIRLYVTDTGQVHLQIGVSAIGVSAICGICGIDCKYSNMKTT